MRKQQINIATLTVATALYALLILVLISTQGCANEGHASLYQLGASARVFSPDGKLVFTGEIRSEAGDYIKLCRNADGRERCTVVKIGGALLLVATAPDALAQL